MNFIINESSQKLRGGYYTPSDLAGFLVRWVNQINPTTVLEPSCGDGAFFRAVAETGGFAQTRFSGFELDPDEAQKAKLAARTAHLDATVRAEDFLAWALKHLDGKTRFDAAVGNPPFVRYQYLPPEFQPLAEQVFRRLGLPFTKHTNAWVPFILASMELLRPGGRLAMVVPSEIMHVMHAQSLRTYLGTQCRRLVIVDPEEIWFENTLQGAVLLLAEKRGSAAETPEGLGVYSVRGRDFIQRDPGDVFNAPRCLNGKTVEGKWTRALLDKSTRDLIDELLEHPNVHRFKDVADVDVGIVTGANKYFLVTDETVDHYDLHRWAHPMFGRSEHCPGVIYDSNQHEANARNGNPTNFLWFDPTQRLDAAAKTYVRFGEEQNLQTRYKCRVRSPWYSVPSVYSTEIGMLKRSHDTPRLILNKVGAFTTDTAYRIQSKKASAQTLVASFVNPLTALSADLEGRHYGGGVLELVPSEIERLAVPVPEGVKLDLKELDADVRVSPADQVLEKHGRHVLDPLGISHRQQDQLLDAWKLLRNRRQRIPSED